LESALQKELVVQAAAAEQGLASAHFGLVLGEILTVLAGLLAALGVWLGFAQRLEEYR
jgi:hypothetical protein